MATPRHDNRRFRTGWRGVSLAEVALTLCVILGLLFVTMRISAMGFRVSETPIGVRGTNVVKAEPALPAPIVSTSVTR